MVIINTVKESKSLDEARYFHPKHIIPGQGPSSKAKLNTLPPTSGSTEMHSYCVFLQGRFWNENGFSSLDFWLEVLGGY